MNAFPHITHAAKTDVGRKRKNNEDAFGVYPDAGVFCVADGMGGGDDGEIASAAVVKSVGAFAIAHRAPPNAGYPAGDVASGVVAAVNEASAWICARAASRGLKGCGSTFVGVCLDATAPSEAVVLHAGDSRLYRVRGASVKQITKDHSAAELIGAKDESAVNPCFRGVILRAVGIHPSVDVERTPLPLKEDDRIVICSDGLSKMVDDRKIAAIVHGAATPETAANALVAAANAAGGADNVTAVVLFVGKLPPPMPAMPMRATEASADSNEDAGDADTSSTGSGGGFGLDTDTADEPQTIPTMAARPQKRDGFAEACRIPHAGTASAHRAEARRNRALRVVAAVLTAATAAVLAASCSIYLVRRAKAREAEAEAERQRNVQVLAAANAGAVANERRRWDGGAQEKTGEDPIAISIERELETSQDGGKGEASGREGDRSAPVAGLSHEVGEECSAEADEDAWVSQTLPKLVMSCAATNSESLVRTVRRFPVKGGVETLLMRFRPLCDEKLPIARRRAIAAAVTADMQDISKDLRRYAERRLGEIDAALAEHTTRAEFVSKLAAEREGLRAFMAATEKFVEMGASSAEAQTVCADVMLRIANWFRQVN